MAELSHVAAIENNPDARSTRLRGNVPLVSVVIPTYNRASFLPPAIESVLAQTCPDLELIIVDDGSEDSSEEVVQSFGDPRIRYLRQPHRGVSAARNAGIRASTSPWIALLDSDDQWLPRKLEIQLQALQEAPLYRLAHGEEIWIRRGRRVNPKKIHRKYGGWIYHRCLPLCTISPSAALMHRQLLERVGLFDEDYQVCEDYELWLRTTCRHPVLHLSEPLIVKVGGHADQLSRSLWGMDRFRLQALVKTFGCGHLTPQQEIWTAREIVRKAAILEQGFANRGKIREASRYCQVREAWSAIGLGSSKARSEG